MSSTSLHPPKSPKILVIVGPTASGKSELAVELAKRWNGEVISADSRQVYKGLDIGSGKVPRDKSKVPPSLGSFGRASKNLRQRRIRLGRKKSKLQSKSKNFQSGYFYKGILHHLLDVASPRRTFTAAHYQKLASAAIKKILHEGKLPIIAGGTGFYIDALLHGYDLPRVTPDQKLRRALGRKTAAELFAELKRRDPRRAETIDRHNKRRLVRALEIIAATRRPIPALIRANGRIVNYGILKIGIRVPSVELKKRIAKRLTKRLAGGALVKEVRNLHAQGLSWKRLDDLGLEYRFVSRYLRGLITKEEMESAILRESARYAKRQMTWWRRDNEIVWLKNKKEMEKAVRRFVAAT